MALGRFIDYTSMDRRLDREMIIRPTSWLDNIVLDFLEFFLFEEYHKPSSFLLGGLLFPIWLLRSLIRNIVNAERGVNDERE